jgi:tagatose-1,6-bisphosphate aldolase
MGHGPTLTVGKLRGLRQCSDKRGTLSLLALDHRNNLRKALKPEAPAEVEDRELTADVEVEEISEQRPSFDEVFVRLMEDEHVQVDR